MGRALYRKYRSKKLSEIVGQEHVTTALNNALKAGRIGHAYLFTGPRGTGKTSVARILAHEVNNLPYDESSTHLDIIEIDAASNRRIEEIRSLRERIHNAPTSAKYKVYIIDEVHMLTKEAFNALLKTLEEPPQHVIFILATTEFHKLPDTIVSRTQRYNFKPAEPSVAASHLRTIATKEKLDIDDEALNLIAAHGRGSFRDSISLLDQVSNIDGNIRADDVKKSLGIAPDEIIKDITSSLATGTPADMITLLKTLHENGYHAPQIAKQLSASLRNDLLDSRISIDTTATSTLLKQLVEIPTSHEPFTLLEITLLEPILNRHNGNTVPVKPVGKKTKSDVIQDSSDTQNEKHEERIKPTHETAPSQDFSSDMLQAETQTITNQAATTAGMLDETSWQQVLHALKKQHNTLYGIARMAVPVFDDGKLTLSFSFPFHQKRMDEPKNKQKLSEILNTQLGGEIEIVCITDKSAKSPAKKTTAVSEDLKTNPIDTISNIFGGAEVLE